MKNVIAMLAATAAVGLATSAYAADETSQAKASVNYKDNGGYDSSRNAENTDANGTTTTSSEKVDVDVDSKGLVKKTVKTSDTTDPKGLMNKKTDNSKTVYEEKDNGGYKQTTTRTHKDANGTNVSYKTVTDVDVDKDGNVTTTAKTEKTVDPKGLFNKKTTSETTKTVNGQVVDEKKTSNQ